MAGLLVVYVVPSVLFVTLPVMPPGNVAMTVAPYDGECYAPTRNGIAGAIDEGNAFKSVRTDQPILSQNCWPAPLSA